MVGLLVAGSLIGSLADSAHAAAAAAWQVEPERIQWRSIRLEARKLFLSASTTAEWSLTEGRRVRNDLLVDEGHPLIPVSPQVARLEVYATLPGIRSATTLWMDADNGNALQYRIHDSGRRYRERTVRFATTGATQHTRRPAGNDDKTTPATWTDLSADFWPYATLPDKGPVLDALGLLYVVAGGPLLKPGDHLDTLVFQRRKLAQVGLTVDRLTDVPVSYRITGPKTARTCTGTAKALQIRLTVDPYRSDQSDFEFLGLKSDIYVLVEPESRLILKIEGQAAVVGHVVSTLAAAELPSAARCPGSVGR